MGKNTGDSERKIFIAGEEGEFSYELWDFVNSKQGLIGINTIFLQRPGFSDQLLYGLIHKVLNDKSVSVIFTLPQPSRIPLEPPPFVLDLEQRETIQNNIVIGIAYRILANDDDEAAQTLASFRSYLSGNSLQNPIILVFDSIHKWGDSLESEVRYWLREAPQSNISIWLHCPLDNLPVDLVTTVGSVVAVWPSKNEITLLRNMLPLREVTWEGESSHNGILIYSHELFKSEKGWQLTSAQEWD